MRIIRRFLVLVGLLCSVTAVAKEPAVYGPKGRQFGAGLYLGEPTGFTAKGYLSERWALDGIASWSFVDDAFTLIGDFTYELLDLPVETNVITLPFYIGGGGKIGVNGSRTVGAVRAPIGLAFQWTHHPVEAFVEIAPGMGVAPATNFDFTGGFGARYYF